MGSGGHSVKVGWEGGEDTLLSDESSYITGAEVAIDGGASL